MNSKGFAIVWGGAGKRKAITRMAGEIGLATEVVEAGDVDTFGHHMQGAARRLRAGDLFWLTLFEDSGASVIGSWLSGFRPGVRIVVLSARPFGDLAGRYGPINASVIWISGGGDLMLQAAPTAWQHGRFVGDHMAFYRALVERLPADPPIYQAIGTLDPLFETQRPFTVSPPPPPALHDLWWLLYRALVDGTRVIARYNGLRREMFLLDLGTTRGEWRAFVQILQPAPSRAGQFTWRCFRLEGLTEVQPAPISSMIVAPTDPRGQSCIDVVDARAPLSVLWTPQGGDGAAQPALAGA